MLHVNIAHLLEHFPTACCGAGIPPMLSCTYKSSPREQFASAADDFLCLYRTSVSPYT